jgi:hypothetical protein
VNPIEERRRALGYHRPHKGGSSTSASQTDTTTVTNTDRRAVLEGSTMVGDGGFASLNTNTSTNTSSVYNLEAADAGVLDTLARNIPDAVKAVTSASADTFAKMGGAIVDLNRDSIAANTKNVDTVLNAGAEMVDKLIDGMSAGYGLASEAVSSFKPVENSNADIGKYAMLAAAAVAAAVLLKGSK